MECVPILVPISYLVREVVKLNNLEHRLVELETKISFQEQTIEDLNSALVEQHKDITKLSRIVENLASQVERIEDLNNPNTPEPPPPHY